MRNNDEDLRQAYQSYVMEKIPDSRGGCPTPEMLSDSFDPKMPQETKDGIITHLSRCSSCAREFELIRESLNQAEDLSKSFNYIHGRKACASHGSLGFHSSGMNARALKDIGGHAPFPISCNPWD